MTTLTLNGQPLAIGYHPACPPPPGILADWIRESGSALTTAALDSALRTGGSVELAPGQWLRWKME